MLKSIQFTNYRCFLDHELPLNKETIVVGKNNAGKSTIVEGLRLLAVITQRHKNLAFRKVPEWIEIPSSHRGVGVSLAGLNISWQYIFHRYQDPPARIFATFSNVRKLIVEFEFSFRILISSHIAFIFNSNFVIILVPSYHL